MKTAKLLACCLLILPLAGSVSKSDLRTVARLHAVVPESSVPVPIPVLMREGGALYRAGRYADAAAKFEAAHHSALASANGKLAARALSNVGGCEFATHQYQAALKTFLEARRMAEAAGDRSTAAGLDANISSLYSEMGAYDAAAEWMEGSLKRLSTEDRRRFLPQMLLQMAVLRARQGRMTEAVTLFHEGIDAADQQGNVELYTLGWNRLGAELLAANRLPEAETALLQAYRIRKLHKLPMDSSYRNLGILRLEQGDLTSASALLNRAVELAAQPGGLIPSWEIYSARGRLRLAQGQLRAALTDFRTAVELGQAWRWSAPTGDATLVGAEGTLDRVYSGLIETGNRLYEKTHDPSLIRETFEAAEENRAASLRALLQKRDAPAADLPPQYWTALQRLQNAEVQALRVHNRLAEAEVRDARAQLARADALVGGELQPLPQDLLERARAALQPDEALLSFHVGDSDSWLWALDKNGLLLYRLPPRRQIAREVAATKLAIRRDSPEAAQFSANLYRDLFGFLNSRFENKTRWLLALDQSLFDVPVAALLEQRQPKPVYLVERHTPVVIPGAGYWLESAERRAHFQVAPLFLGVGDPIYNTADARWPKPWSSRRWNLFEPLQIFAASSPAAGLVLPRLVGSGAEIDACARAWGGESILLKGAEASRQSLAQQLRRNPAVVHLATHVLESSEQPAYGLIALSLNPQGNAELLTPFEIAQWRIKAGLVVLSGCDSSEGAELPGTGLMGLTRAWLSAGAGAVLASRWATPDEDGELFGGLYRDLRIQREPDAASALRQAQLAMLHEGGWRARPSYWGTYFVVGDH
ncbi:MAG TPA: CHAT domain-containing protein [Bryobacteraceae bacterium]|nr:CHAT domain-containing protein [Bryobacteraceae bacterium]